MNIVNDMMIFGVVRKVFIIDFSKPTKTHVMDLSAMSCQIESVELRSDAVPI